MMAYFEQPDIAGHEGGPNSQKVAVVALSMPSLRPLLAHSLLPSPSLSLSFSLSLPPSLSLSPFSPLSYTLSILQVNEILTYLDQTVESLFAGLKERGVEECVNVIIVSDHGMTTYDPNKLAVIDSVS